MKTARLTRGGEVDFKLRRKAAWLERLGQSRQSRPAKARVFERPERMYGRKSVVKASYVRNGRGRKFSGIKMMAHARYLERGHGHEKGHKELGFDAEREYVDISETAHNWCLAKDRLHWRLILSPDDVDRVDLREHARKVMAQMEKDLAKGPRDKALLGCNRARQHRSPARSHHAPRCAAGIRPQREMSAADYGSRVRQPRHTGHQ